MDESTKEIYKYYNEFIEKISVYVNYKKKLISSFKQKLEERKINNIKNELM